jgi:hypothetical protein
MNTNKRQRTDDQGRHALTHIIPAASSARTLKLRLCAELAIKLGTRYCSEEELLTLMLRNSSVCAKICMNTISKATSGRLELVRREQLRLGPVLRAYFDFEDSIYERDAVKLLESKGVVVSVPTFEVKAAQMGDLNGDWTTITLSDGHASTADVKDGMEQAKGIKPAMQELFRYDESWTGTKASGGSGHTEEQEDAALLDEGYVFEGPCSVVVSVNELYDVVLEGQKQGKSQCTKMGVYERMEGKTMNGRGVWQLLGMQHFLYYSNNNQGWFVGYREGMEAGADKGGICVESAAATPEEITEGWKVVHNTTRGWILAPKLKVRVCSSVEKHEAVERMEQQQVQAEQGKCRKGHTLQQFLTQDSGYSCDLCGQGVALGALLRGCRSCDFDACLGCCLIDRS